MAAEMLGSHTLSPYGCQVGMSLAVVCCMGLVLRTNTYRPEHYLVAVRADHSPVGV